MYALWWCFFLIKNVFPLSNVTVNACFHHHHHHHDCQSSLSSSSSYLLPKDGKLFLSAAEDKTEHHMGNKSALVFYI